MKQNAANQNIPASPGKPNPAGDVDPYDVDDHDATIMIWRDE